MFSKLKKKFCINGGSYDLDCTINYRPLDIFYRAGLVDSCTYSDEFKMNGYCEDTEPTSFDPEVYFIYNAIAL